MKHASKFMIAATLVVCFFASCKKENTNDNGNGLPAVVNTIVSQAIIDSLTSWGLTINKGTTPTQIPGIYYLSKNDCLFDNSGYNNLGDNYSNYKIKFFNQDNSAYTIGVASNAVTAGTSDSSSTISATFISGNGNLFTVFSQQTGISRGIKDTLLFVYSGEIATTGTAGIKNMQYALYMKGKGSDPYGYLIKVGASRIFKDEDGFSELSKSFYTDSPQGIAVPSNPQPLTNKLSILSAGK